MEGSSAGEAAPRDDGGMAARWRLPMDTQSSPLSPRLLTARGGERSTRGMVGSRSALLALIRLTVWSSSVESCAFDHMAVWSIR